jgi:Lrp/AsnC family leucine-responsive transcriptional regulator
MKSPLDTLDRQLVELLQANGRSSMQELSNETGLSRSAVFTRVRRLEHDGVITGYAAQTNRRALGLQIRAFCNVQLKQHDARFLNLAAMDNIGTVQSSFVMSEVLER